MRAIQSFFGRCQHWAGALWQWKFTLLSAASTLATILVEEPWSRRVSALIAIVGISGAVGEIAQQWKLWGALVVSKPGDRSTNELKLSTRYESWTRLGKAPSELASFWTDWELNAVLRYSDVPLEVRTTLFRVPAAVNRYKARIRAELIAGKAVVVNARKIRLTSDVTIDRLSKPAIVERTTYFRSLVTNDAVDLYIEARHEGIVYSGWDLVVKRNTRVVRDFAESRLSNHMGGSTLAITSDSYLVLQRQGPGNMQSTNLIAPSGSGSFNWRDVQSCRTLQELAIKGVERELREELGLSRTTPARTLLTGYVRDVRRGGLPQFYGVTLLDATADMVKRRLLERGFVHEHLADFPCTLEDLKALRREIQDALEEVRPTASAPLQVAVRLLSELLIREPRTVEKFLRSS